MKRTFLAALMTAMVLFLAGAATAGDPPAPLSTPELKKTIGAGKKITVVFFLNPNGGPCKEQNEVVQKLQKDRKNNFNLVYVSALEQVNQQAFYDYGVRSLPTLVVVDSKGKIARFFPPGIQAYETLSAALDGAK